VVRVVDGDTIRVRIDGVEERVRYIGIDTPELSHPTRGVEPFGPEASAYNEQLVRRRQVCLERDVSDRDRYGRLLRYAWLEDGRMVNEVLVEAGMARVATFPPDVKYIDERLLPAQRSAAAAGRGIWSQ
jgi:micrococcal nuclease